MSEASNADVRAPAGTGMDIFASEIFGPAIVIHPVDSAEPEPWTSSRASGQGSSTSTIRASPMSRWLPSAA